MKALKNDMDNYKLFLDCFTNEKANLGASAANRYKAIPKSAGLYGVWWKLDEHANCELNREVYLKGKVVSKNDILNDISHKDGEYHIHRAEWPINDKGPICVYVGKASDIRKRLSQQIENRKGHSDWYGTPYTKTIGGKTAPKMPSKDDQFLIKRTSGCQIRAGIEHLFKYTDLSLMEKLGQFFISWVEEPDFKERFYLEDLAIGYYRPWFNLDCER